MNTYLRTLCERFGAGWNRFWFTPSDPATLGVLRVLTGLIALYLHATFSVDLVRFFSADGLLPTSTVRELWSDWTAVSYLNWLRSPTELWIAHGIGLIVLLLFTVGAFTRVTSVLALIVTLAYIHRAPLLASQVEPIVTFVMFYLCLGPSGAVLSVDAWLARRKRGGMPAALGTADAPAFSTTATIATRLIQVHVAAVYLMMALAKLRGGDYGPVWWAGEAVWWLIAKPESRLVDFTWLHAHPYVVNFWTHAIVLFEFMFPLLIWNRLARPLLLVWAAVMWGLLALLTGLVPFCLMMLAASLAFITPETVRWLLASVAARSSRDQLVSEPRGRVSAASR